jgi:hypothetical protein
MKWNICKYLPLPPTLQPAFDCSWNTALKSTKGTRKHPDPAVDQVATSVTPRAPRDIKKRKEKKVRVSSLFCLLWSYTEANVVLAQSGFFTMSECSEV